VGCEKCNSITSRYVSLWRICHIPGRLEHELDQQSVPATTQFWSSCSQAAPRCSVPNLYQHRQPAWQSVATWCRVAHSIQDSLSILLAHLAPSGANLSHLHWKIHTVISYYKSRVRQYLWVMQPYCLDMRQLRRLRCNRTGQCVWSGMLW